MILKHKHSCSFIVTWHCKENHPSAQIQYAAGNIVNPYFHDIITGSDEFGVVISKYELKSDAAQELYNGYKHDEGNNWEEC